MLVALIAAALPVAALAAKPPHPSAPANTNANTSVPVANAKGSSAKVLFVLRGTITGYTAGSNVSIKVTGSNFESKTLETMTLTFPVNSKTKVTGTVKPSDAGIVKLNAPKNASASVLQTLTAFEVIDQHAGA
jgi:hypothetical protein